MPLTRITIPPLVLAGLMVVAPILAAAETPRAILDYGTVEQRGQDDGKRVVDVSTVVATTSPCPETRTHVLRLGAKSCTVVVQGRDSSGEVRPGQAR